MRTICRRLMPTRALRLGFLPSLVFALALQLSWSPSQHPPTSPPDGLEVGPSRASAQAGAIYLPYLARGAGGSGPKAQIAHPAMRIAAARDAVFVLKDDPTELVILDNRPGKNLARAGSYSLAEGYTSSAVELLADPERRFAYLLYSLTSLQAMDVAGIAEPRPMRLLAAPDATRMALDDNWLYIAGDGLRVIDIRNPERPNEVAYAFRAGTGQAVATEGHRVYVAQKEPTSGRPTTLYVWDVSNRSAPADVGALRDVGPTIDMAALGGFAYPIFDYTGVAGQQAKGSAMRVVDARDPNAVREVGRYEVEGYPRAVLRFGERLYLAEEGYFDRRTRQEQGANRIHVLDIGDLGQPRLVGHVPLEHPPVDLDARGDELFVALGEGGVAVIELGR